MPSVDESVLETLVRWLEGGHRAYLATVLQTWGSSPRPAGSLLALRDDGRMAGSVSGGCVEDELAERVRAGEFLGGCPKIERYGVTRDQAERVGLPCGGRLELMLEELDAPTQPRALLDALRGRRSLARRLCLVTSEVSLHPAQAQPDFSYDGRDLIRVFGPQWQLIIIGASHVAEFLAPIAVSLGYRVVVCEPRSEYAQAWDVQIGEIDTGMPDDVVRARADDPRSAVVALTHDPKLDDMALMEALDRAAYYVGALGSRTNNEKRRRRLLELGLTAEAVARLRGPVGLPIGGRTPPEIAVSIAADLIAARHGRILVGGASPGPA